MGLMGSRWNGVYSFLFRFIFISSLAVPTFVNAANPPGVSSGSANVSNLGAASYQIPIIIPAGVRGMQPSVSLSYGSHRPNGIMGVGWDVNGFASIKRCPKTWATDNETGGVHHDADDKFCLDGQRLILVNGNYGEDLSEYRKEIDDFSKIQAFGSVPNKNGGTAPAYFKVWTKAGTILTLGNAPLSTVRLEDGDNNPNTGSIHSWLLNRVEDRFGNHFNVVYKDVNTEQCLPDYIEYGGNLAQSTNHDRKVKFTYESRPDPIDQWVLGTQFQSTVRLQKVETFVNDGANDTLVRDYTINYETASDSQLSRVTSINECGYAGAGSSCVTTQSFDWGDAGTFDFTATLDPVTNNLINGGEGIQTGDFNADGKTDFLWHRSSDGENRWYISNGDGTFTENVNPIQENHLNNGKVYLGDWNGDGITDILLYTKDIGRNDWFINDGNLNFTLTEQDPISTSRIDDGTAIHIGDWNNDGISDLMWHDGRDNYGTNRWYINDGAFNFTEHVNPIQDEDIDDGAMYFGDFNGDGITDTLFYRRSKGLNRWFVNDGKLNFVRTTDPIKIGDINGGTAIILRDLNGDKITDMMWYNNSGRNRWYINRGDLSFIRKLDPIPRNYMNNATHPKFADLDHDGDTDVVTYQAACGCNNWYLNDGENNFTLEWLSPIPRSELTTSGAEFRLGDFNGDGNTDFFYYRKSNGDNHVYISNRSKADLLTKVTDGLGAETTFTHEPMTNSMVYIKGDTIWEPSSYPNVYIQTSRYLVSGIATSDGLGGSRINGYQYYAAKVNLRGRGLLGFKLRRTMDWQKGEYTDTDGRQDFPFTGRPNIITRLKVGTTIVLNESTTSYGHNITTQANGNKTYFTYTAGRTDKANETDGSPVTTTTTTNQYDLILGNLTQRIVDRGNGFITTSDIQYDSNIGNWVLGMPTYTTVTQQAPGQSTITNTVDTINDLVNGVVTDVIVEPNGAANVRSETHYTYDVFGNRVSETISGANIASRTSSISYDSQGRFPLTITNALNHAETRVYDVECGTVTSLTGPNNLTNTATFDEFCRPVTATSADGVVTTNTYQYETGTYAFSVTTETNGPALIGYGGDSDPTTQVAPQQKIYTDILGRTVRSETQGLDDSDTIYQDTEHDNFGRVDRVSTSYYSGNTVYWTEFEYDILNRRTKTTAPNGSETETTYNGLVTTVTEKANGVGEVDQIRVTTVNVAGQVVSIKDAANNTMTYAYDAQGNLKQATDPLNNSINLTYDIRGRRTILDDPDMGVWNYAYNSLSELVSQTDAKLNVTTQAYDLLGRLTSRTTVEGTSTWTYDTSPVKGIGKLHTASGVDGYSRTHHYDSLGRAISTDFVIDGQNFTSSVTYNGNSQINTVSYPGIGFTIRNEYSKTGRLNRVRNHTSGNLLYHRTHMLATGHTLKENWGNNLQSDYTFNPQTLRLESIQTHTTGSSGGAVQNLSYIWDSFGNLKQRSDSNQNATETFGYDILNRLTSASVNGASAHTVRYDAIGNITFKSGAGAYTYGSSRPHAVTHVDGSATNLNLAAGHDPSGNYIYDANGNIITAPGRTISWTSFNKPSSISSDGNTVAFMYDAEQHRVKKDVNNGSKVTLYIGKAYEQVTEGASTIHRYHVSVGGATVQITKETSQADEVRYLHTDHLGSTDVITDESGTVVENLSFDPWGLRRNADWTVGSAPIPSQSVLGYTGHEQDDEIGLVNMNARIYDPVLGRFLSPDSFIPSPGDLQSFNRYAYVRNKPLNRIDPTGNLDLGFIDIDLGPIDDVFDVILDIAEEGLKIIGEFFFNCKFSGSNLECGVGGRENDHGGFEDFDPAPGIDSDPDPLTHVGVEIIETVIKEVIPDIQAIPEGNIENSDTIFILKTIKENSKSSKTATIISVPKGSIEQPKKEKNSGNFSNLFLKQNLLEGLNSFPRFRWPNHPGLNRFPQPGRPNPGLRPLRPPERPNHPGLNRFPQPGWPNPGLRPLRPPERLNRPGLNRFPQPERSNRPGFKPLQPSQSPSDLRLLLANK